MRILHVIPGVGDAANGIAVAARRIAGEQRRLGYDVACGERFDSAVYRGADLVFVHSCWTPTVWRGCREAARAGVRLVRMTHACLDPVRLAYHGWRKRLVGAIERKGLRAAACVVATCPAEATWIRAYEPGVKNVVISSLGVDVPAETAPGTGGGGPKRLLYLGRWHPLKGLDLLEEAMAGLEGVTLRVESAVFGDGKARALADCDALVLPTRSENFGLVVAEALAAGRPVIVTDGAPWNGVQEKGCGWFVEGFGGSDFDRARAVANLRKALAAFVATSRGDLAAMGGRGRAWMRADHDWGRVVAQLMARL